MLRTAVAISAVLLTFLHTPDYSWSDERATSDEATQWLATGLTDPQWWAGQGFSPNAAAEWAVVGFAPPEAAALARAGVKPDEATPWRKPGLEARDILVWVRAGFHPIGEFWEWAKAGVSPERAAKWAKVTDRLDALEWAGAGFDPDEAQQWSNIRGLIPDEARAFRYLGVEPSTAGEIKVKRCMGVPITGSDFGYAPHENDVYNVNPFEAIGKCFFIKGRVLQLLDRTIVLVQPLWSSSDTIRLDFAPNAGPAEGRLIYAIGIGKEPFRYTAVRGDERITADIAVIVMKVGT